MCRLFGLHAGRNVVTATFWLLDAADSLAAQSKRNPDGAGIGVFDAAGEPVLDKQPIAAWKDAQFAAEAKNLSGTTFLAHVRYATTGDLDARNTHPFLQDGRLFAHNGVVEGLTAASPAPPLALARDPGLNLKEALVRWFNDRRFFDAAMLWLHGAFRSGAESPVDASEIGYAL